MPTYAYACSSCSHAFDIYQSFSDDALTVCPDCDEESLRKVFSAVGVVFKGSGFYRNDSRSTKPSSETSSSKQSAAKETKSESASTKSDSSSSSSSTSTSKAAATAS